MTIAFYLRLSESDGDIGEDGKDESNSIENQRLLLNDFVESNEEMYGKIREYVDDGYSGTNFERPAFKRMLEDAKKGLIQILLVKDLSRLGRDYISVGDYIEQIFPMLNVRFIAVHNGYDSSKMGFGKMEFDMEVSNLINTFYSRDLSKKMRNANRTRWKNGINNGKAPFGYLRDPQKSGKWLLDPEAAKIVRLIFDKALEGMNTSQIAFALNEEHIPTPGEYNMTHRNWKLGKPVKPKEERLWDSSKVHSIIRKYEYTGALVMGKRENIMIGKNNCQLRPKKDWIIVDGVNEAIVTKKEYEEAQGVIRTKNRPEFISDRKYALKGKARCGNCRTCLDYYDHGVEEVFFCGHGTSVGKFSDCCTEKYSVRRINGVVFHAIKSHLKILEKCALYSIEKGKQGIVEGKARIRAERSQLESLKAEKIRQYELYADGAISRDTYIKKREILNREIKELEQSVVVNENGMDKNVQLLDIGNQMKGVAERFYNEEKLTSEMVEALIENIYIYNPDQIEVVFKFKDAVGETAYTCGKG